MLQKAREVKDWANLQYSKAAPGRQACGNDIPSLFSAPLKRFSVPFPDDVPVETKRLGWNRALEGYQHGCQLLAKVGTDGSGIAFESERLQLQKSLYKNQALCNFKLAQSNTAASTKKIYFLVSKWVFLCALSAKL